MRITKEEFIEIYAGTTVVKYVDLFYSTPKNETDMRLNYMTSKLWRLNNIYTITNKHGQLVTFVMNKSQHKVYAASLRHPRLIILKSRQQGISTLWLVSYFDDAIFFRNYKIGLMAQGQDEAITLLERTKILWQELHSDVKRYASVNAGKDNTKEFGLSNRSTIFIRTSFRSTTLQRLHISEMGKIANKYPEKAKETKTGTLQAIAPGNTCVIESTAEGDNLFKTDWDKAMQYTGERTLKDFLPVFLSWLDDPDCALDTHQIADEKQEKYFAEVEQVIKQKLTQRQKNFWIAQHRELGDRIFQEYPSTPDEAFLSTKEGSYYSKFYLKWVRGYNREIRGLHDPNLDVQVTFDLGASQSHDTMVMGFSQEYTDGVRIIDEYTDSGEDIKFYCDLIKEWMEKKGYRVTRVVLPHDAEVMELTSGKTREEKFREELPGVDIVVLSKDPISEGIDEVRRMIKRLWIDPKCKYIIDCFYNYRKEWDEKSNTFKAKAHKDEYNHGADMIRYIAMSLRGYKRKEPRSPRKNGMDV